MIRNKQTKFIFGGLLLAAVLLYVFTGTDEVIGTYGINKTVGWAWHVSSILPLAAYIFILLGLVAVYLILNSKGVRLNKWLTGLHSISFIGILPFYIVPHLNSEIMMFVIAGLLLLSFVLFSANCIISVIKYLRAKRNIDYQK